MSRQTLRKSEILRGYNTFQKVFQVGDSFSGTMLKCFVLKRENRLDDSSEIMVGFSVAKTVRLAVLRNRVKRLMREVVRKNKVMLHALVKEKQLHLAMIFLYVGNKTVEMRRLNYADVEKDFTGLVQKIQKKL